MAGRPRLQPGELGSVNYEPHPAGVRARARCCDAGGTVRRLTATASTEELARDSLEAQARALGFVPDAMTAHTTLGELLPLWVESARAELRPQTARVYASTAAWLTSIAGAIPVRELTLRRCKQLLAEIRQGRSPWAARQARVALNGVFAIAVDERLVDFNPLARQRATRGDGLDDSEPVALTAAQVGALRRAVLEREERNRSHVGPSAGVLRWTTEVALGSGLRIGEVLGLRRMDVDLEAGVIEVTGTLIDDEEWKVERQNRLKGNGQARRIVLPKFAVDALREAHDAATSEEGTSPAIQSRNGGWVQPRNLRRALRDVRESQTVAAALATTGLAPGQLTPHTLRRTASTLVAAAQGNLSGARNLLGHSDERTTRKFYAGVAYRMVGEAELLDELLGGGSAGE